MHKQLVPGSRHEANISSGSLENMQPNHE